MKFAAILNMSEKLSDDHQMKMTVSYLNLYNSVFFHKRIQNTLHFYCSHVFVHSTNICNTLVYYVTEKKLLTVSDIFQKCYVFDKD